MSNSGYIYFASNPSMPGLLKIGVTDESPSRRLPQLHTTGVPTPFVLEASIRVVDLVQAEGRIHELLAQVRQVSNREFFKVSVRDALALCLPHLMSFMASDFTKADASKLPSLPTDEETVLRFLAQRINKSGQPTKSDVQQSLNLRGMKAELLFGNLVKRRFIREVFGSRSHQVGPDSYEHYKVRVLKLERAGIQYLIDHGFVDRQEL